MFEYNQYFRINIILTVLSFIFFQYVVRAVVPAISKNFKIYRNLSEERRIDWVDKSASTVHAVICLFLAITSLSTDQEGYDNPPWGQHWASASCVCLSLGYAIYDLIFVAFELGLKKEDYGIIIHHFFMIVGTGGCVIYGCLWHLWIYRALGELSTPFLNLRLILTMIGRKDSKLAFYNNLLFALSFFISRILALPYVYLLYYKYWSTEGMIRVGLFRYSFLFLAAMDVLNVYWFCLIMRGFYKVFFVKKQKSK